MLLLCGVYIFCICAECIHQIKAAGLSTCAAPVIVSGRWTCLYNRDSYSIL